MAENIAGSGKVADPVGAEERMSPEEASDSAETAARVAAASSHTTIINNETDMFIGIDRKQDGNPLLIAPFGSRTMNWSSLEEYAYEDWLEQKLISIKDPGSNENEVGNMALGFSFILLGLFLLISIPINLIFHSISWRVIGLVPLAGVILTALVYSISGRKARAEREGRKSSLNISGWLKLAPGIVLILATGLGLPFAATYFFGDGRQLMLATPQLASLGRLAQVSFIAIVSILPTLFFYLFGRQQVDTQKGTFYKEVLALDPNLHSLTEARTKYETLIDSVYGSGNSPLSFLLLFISTMLLVMGWLMVMGTIDTPAMGAKSLVDFFVPQRSVFTFGVLGAYFFTLNMVFRRYVRADLTPKTYAHITVRLLVTIVLVWVVSSLPQFQAGSVGEASLFAIAFMIGVIPETGLTLIQDYVKKLVRSGVKDEEVLSLDQLEGIHLYDRARLLEEGIENIENLAHHNMIELIARTRIPTQRVVDLFDQSILYLHLGLEDEENRKFLRTLKGYGIRTATDLHSALWTPGAFEALKNITPPLPLDKMTVIFQALFDDEWYDHVVQWRLAPQRRKEVIHNPWEFYFPSSPAPDSMAPVATGGALQPAQG
jgi:hypothetical protein